MPIPKRTASQKKKVVEEATSLLPKKTTTSKKIVKEATPTHADIYDDSTVSNSNSSKSGPWCWKILLIVLWIFILCIIINAAVNSSSSRNYYNSYSSTSSSSYNYNNTSTSTTTNTYEKDWKCKWSDGGWYPKPIHGYCDWWKTPLWWKCNAWYYAKSENDKTWLNSSWYCAANCTNFNCEWYNYIPCTYEQEAIPTYVNQYSQASVDNYNAKVAAYNRCLSEKCSCR